MPADYKIDREQKLVLSRAWGVVTIRDFLGHGHRLLADPDFRPDFRQLWDLTEITSTLTNFTELAEMAKVSVFAPTSRRAILAPVDVAFGVARMFQMLRESKGETGIRVFRDRAEALHWLETGEEPPPPPRHHSADPLKNSPHRA
jgi:hypothetical protein